MGIRTFIFWPRLKLISSSKLLAIFNLAGTVIQITTNWEISWLNPLKHIHKTFIYNIYSCIQNNKNTVMSNWSVTINFTYLIIFTIYFTKHLNCYKQVGKHYNADLLWVKRTAEICNLSAWHDDQHIQRQSLKGAPLMENCSCLYSSVKPKFT